MRRGRVGEAQGASSPQKQSRRAAGTGSGLPAQFQESTAVERSLALQLSNCSPSLLPMCLSKGQKARAGLRKSQGPVGGGLQAAPLCTCQTIHGTHRAHHVGPAAPNAACACTFVHSMVGRLCGVQPFLEAARALTALSPLHRLGLIPKHPTHHWRMSSSSSNSRKSQPRSIGTISAR